MVMRALAEHLEANHQPCQKYKLIVNSHQNIATSTALLECRVNPNNFISASPQEVRIGDK